MSSGPWHSMEALEVAVQSGSNLETGLSQAEANARLARHGRNDLEVTGARGPWRILAEQLSSLMMGILIAAAAISAVLQDYKDAIVIGIIVVLNAILGFTQEYRAEQAMAALRKLAAPVSRVRRDGEIHEITSRDLVPGDIVFLEAGNAIAADCRVLESVGLRALEAALTGESEPIDKVSSSMDRADLALGDRRNMVYRGTVVSAGRGAAIVTETGMRTEIGKIAGLMQRVEQEVTPLQKRLSQLGKVLALAALGIVAVIFVLGLLRGDELKLLFLTAVSIGVAAVPEGLPAVVTIALALGAQRMLRRRVLVRRLACAETLGSVTTICSDKTGTLTENRMTVEVVQLPGRVVSITKDAGKTDDPDLKRVLTAGALCNDAVLHPAELGDPTEIALAVAAERFGLMRPELEKTMPRTGEIAFDAVRKRMTTLHRGIQSNIAFTKGSFDGLLQVASSVWVDGRAEPLNDHWRKELARQNESMAASGMRVLGAAMRELPDGVEPEAVEQDLVILGMFGILDPPRAEAGPAVSKCQEAGIRAVMITGDHPLTASSIASKLGIHDGSPANRIVTGLELDNIHPRALEDLAQATPVYARVTPEHKLRIVESLQTRGEIVAMTGDGINDAPALKRADIGVAMGITGTDVAKEAADMVLLDDNFATIVEAVEEGRVIYDNVRKFIRYILTTNTGEIWVMLAAPLLGMPIPLLPLQILWMNLVTDGLPALALGVEPAEEDVMRRPPRPPNEHVLARGLGIHVLWVGLLMAVLCLGTGYRLWSVGDPHWQTMLFTTLTFSQMAHVLAIRSERQSLFHIGLFSNPAMAGAVLLTFLLQFALVYVPFLQQIFRTAPLPPSELALAIGVSSLVFVAVELEKRFRK
jgi:P-type Ca2+ transporter type 2C